jgi:hypothetical protein
VDVTNTPKKKRILRLILLLLLLPAGAVPDSFPFLFSSPFLHYQPQVISEQKLAKAPCRGPFITQINSSRSK